MCVRPKGQRRLKPMIAGPIPIEFLVVEGQDRYRHAKNKEETRVTHLGSGN